jgi:outer membrane protein
MKIFLLGFFFLWAGCSSQHPPLKMENAPSSQKSVEEANPNPGQIQADHILNKSELNLEDCYQLALAYNDRLKIAGENYYQAVLLKSRAWSEILPKVDFKGSYFQQASAAEFGSLKERRETKFTAEQPLFQGFREINGLQGAKYQALSEAAQLQFEKTLVFANVAAAVYEILKLESTLQTLDLLIQNQKERLKDAQERHKLGLIRRTEVLLIETDLEDAKAKRVSAFGNLRVARAKIAVLLGVQIHQPLVDHEDTSDWNNIDKLLEEALVRREDLKSLAYDIKVARKEVLLVTGEFLPTVNFLGNYYLHRDGPQEGVDWDVLVAGSLPIFEGGDIRARLKEASSKFRQAEYLYEFQKKTVIEEVSQAFAVYESLKEETAVLKKKVDLAEENYHLVTEEYHHGLATHLDVQLVYQQLVDAKLAYEQARWNHKVSKAQIKYVSGQI